MRTLPSPDTLLGGLTIEAFLENYWQKKPLLIRGAFPGYEAPFTPEDLLQIACNDDVEGRLILEKDGDYPWQLLHGPFEEDFHDLPESHWTILVQEINRHVPEVAALLDAFRFIPSWRIDDVMVSFATEHGGVGAHIDNYDVFLLQGLGHRRWQIMHEPLYDEVLIPDLDVSMLQHFRPDEDWVLAPGDMLYLPPRIAHKGIALGDCMTLSIGFRAPSYSEILSGFLGYAAEHADPLARFSDPDLTLQKHPGQITPDALRKVKAIIREAVQDDKMIEDWFGLSVTEPRRGYYAMPPVEEQSAEKVKADLLDNKQLYRAAGTTFAFTKENGDATLFAGGLAFLFPAPIADAVPLLSDAPNLTAGTLAHFIESDTFIDLLCDLINEGYLEWQEPNQV